MDPKPSRSWGVSKLRPSKFAAPKRGAQRKIWRGVKNTEHVKLGLKSASRSCRQKKTVHRTLSRCKLDRTYADIVLLSDKQAETLFRVAGVLGPRKERLTCWQCGSKMKPCSAASSSTGSSSKDVQECPRCRDASRHKLQISSSSLAYSPWWNGSRRGYVPQYKLYLRTVFALGVELPLGSLPHVVPDKQAAVGEAVGFENTLTQVF